MGLIFSKLQSVFRQLTGQSDLYKIVLVGLNNAGKTTILYKLSIGTTITTQPTIGCNIEEVQ